MVPVPVLTKPSSTPNTQVFTFTEVGIDPGQHFMCLLNRETAPSNSEHIRIERQLGFGTNDRSVISNNGGVQ